MIANIIKQQPLDDHHIRLLQVKDEQGLGHYYKRFYTPLYYWALNYLKDDTAASAITQDAFLLLWLMGKKVDSTTQVYQLLSSQVQKNCRRYYKQSVRTFQQMLVRLDDLEPGHVDALLQGVEIAAEEKDFEKGEDAELDSNKWKAVERALPNLAGPQQTLIKLSLRYAFNYERIAWHLGGISDYELALKLEQAIKNLRDILTSAQKLEAAAQARAFNYSGSLSPEQAALFHMRYALKLSFDEIATQMNLSRAQVNTIFLKACTATKN